MANRRMLARDISISKKVNRLPDFEALLYTWMIPFYDDFGLIDGDPEVIKAQVIPMRNVKIEKVAQALAHMADLGLIVWYQSQGKLVIECVKFEDYQTNLHKRTATKFPTRDDNSIILFSENFREFLGSSDPIELKGTELKGREGKGKDDVPPSPSTPKNVYAENDTENVTLKESEYQTLIEKHGEDLTLLAIEKLNNHKGAKGVTYKSDYSAINQWAIKAAKKEMEELSHSPPKNGQKVPLAFSSIANAIGEEIE